MFRNKMKKPNYTMLRLCLVYYKAVKKEHPELEQMPKGSINPGYDVDLMQPLAVLKYLCGTSTQWSCQGNHKDGTATAYILLPTGENFPPDLMARLDKNNFYVGQVKDYDENLCETGKFRIKLESSWDKKIKEPELRKANQKLLELLNNWAVEKIRDHLDKMKDPYYQDVVSFYKVA